MNKFKQTVWSVNKYEISAKDWPCACTGKTYHTDGVCIDRSIALYALIALFIMTVTRNILRKRKF